MSSSTDAILPHDKDAEQGVLGAIIHDNEAIHQVLDSLEPEFFFSPAHRDLYQAMRELNERSEPIDEVTIVSFLRSRDKLDAVGGPVYVAELRDVTPVAANITAYAEIVREKFHLRSLIGSALEIASKGQSHQEDVETLIQQAEETFLNLANSAHQQSYAKLDKLLEESFAMLERAQDPDAETSGLPTGFTELDHLTNGLNPSDLIVLAARPGMGKTSFALSIAKHAALRRDKPVLVFSLEMAREQLSLRLLCMEANVDSRLIRSGELDDQDWERLSEAAGRLHTAKVFIDDTPLLTPVTIKAMAKRLQGTEGLGLIVVDYLQLMRTNRRVDNREQEIAEISRALKSIAKELNVPIIACAQLNREVERRAGNDRRPRLADLRESGAIEQDADIVMFIYRDEIYNPETEDKGIAEIHVAKHRHGPTTAKGIRLAFHDKYTRFGNLSLRPEDEATPPWQA